MEYTLRHFNTPLLRFTSKADSADPEYTITWLNEEDRSLLPLDLEVSPEGIGRWIRHSKSFGNGTRDQDSIDMMNITLDTMSVDVGYLYGWSTSFINTCSDGIAKGENFFSSGLAKSTKSINKLIENGMKQLTE